MNESNNNANSLENHQPIDQSPNAISNVETNLLTTQPAVESVSTAAPVVQSAPVVEPIPVAQPAPVVEPTPVVQPTPVVEPTTVVQPTPVVEPTTVAQPAPVVEPTTVVQPTPVVETTTVVQPTPVAEPTPVVQPAPVVEPTTVVQPTPVVEPTPAIQPTPVVENTVFSEMSTINSVQSPVTGENIIPNNTDFSTTSEPVAIPVSSNLTSEANTTNFVANTVHKEKKDKKSFKFIGIIAIIALIAVVGYFVVYPLIVKAIITPEKVYKNTIDAVFKEINTTVDDVVLDKGIFSANLTLDSNIPLISSFSGYTYGLNMGSDSTKMSFQMELQMKNSSTDYSFSSYIKDNKMYSRFSTDKVLNYLGELSEEESNQLFDGLQQVMEAQKNTNTESVNYVINKINELVVSSIDESKLSQEETTIFIGGSKVKVLNNKYIIDDKTIDATVKHVIYGLKEDRESIKHLATILDYTEDDVKSLLVYEETKQDDLESNEEENSPVIINIYVNFKGDFVGIKFTDNTGDLDVHYYKNKKAFDIVWYSKTKDEETNKDIENHLIVTGIPKAGKTTVSVKYNDKNVANAVINKMTDTELDLNYQITLEENEQITGSLSYKNEQTSDKTKKTLKFKTRTGEQYLNVDFATAIDWSSEVAKINTGNAVAITEEEYANKLAQFEDALKESPFGILFQTSSGDMSDGIDDYYDENDDNYYELYPEESEIDFDNGIIFEDSTNEDDIVYID